MDKREIRFDGWAVNFDSGELTRDGNTHRLPEQPLQILEELVSRPGEVVTREQLIARLWPKGVVEFDTGLNSAIRKLRNADMSLVYEGLNYLQNTQWQVNRELFDILDQYAFATTLGDLPDEKRLEALRFAFFAPGHDATVWLKGWHPEIRDSQRAAVAAVKQSDWWAGGTAPLSPNDGTLATAVPTGRPAYQDSYVYNPAAGAAVPSGKEGPDAFAPYVPLDQTVDQPDGLTFTTDALTEPLRLAGPSEMRFWAVTEASDMAWVARLMDVAPDGSQQIIIQGWLRASFRHVDPDRSRPGSPYLTDDQNTPVGVGEDTDGLNEAVWLAHRHDTAEQALSFSRESHARLMRRLATMSDADLRRSYNHYQPNDPRDPGDDRPVVEWVAGNTYEHYA